MSGEDIVANVRLNATEFYGTLRQMNSEINSQTREWKSQFSALSKSGDWVGAYKAKVEGLNAVYTSQQEKIKSLRSQMDALADSKDIKDIAELKKLSSELKSAEAQAKLFDVQLKNSQLSYAKAQTGIHELGAEHKILTQITKANSEVFEKQGLQYTANAEKARGLVAETRNLNQQFQAQKEMLSVLKSAYNAYTDEQKQSDTYAKQLARDIKTQETSMLQTSSAIRNNQTEYKSLGTNIANVGTGVSMTADHINNMGKRLVSSGQSMQQFGFFSQTASMGMVSMFRQGIDGSAKLDQSLRETYNMLDKKPEGGMNAFLKEYSGSIADLSKQWGVSQTDIANGMQEVIRAGYDEKSAFEIAKSSMQTAMATGEDYGQIMSGTTQIMSQFNLKTNDASQNMANANRIQNALAKIANDTQTSYVGLADAMAKVGPVASNMGYTVEQTGSLIGYMANKGIDASQAGNNLRMVFQRLAAPTKASSGALQELGISATDAQGNMKKLPEIMDQIGEATKNMGSAQRQEVIKTIFGAYATTAANALLDGREEIEKEANAAGKAVSEGYTKGLSDSNIKGADAQIKIFKAQWQALAMEFATSIMPTLVQVMKTAGDLIKWFDQLSPSVKKTVAEFVAFAAVISPLAIALGSVNVVAGTMLGVFSKVIMPITGYASSLLKLKSAATAAKDIEIVGEATTRVARNASLASSGLGIFGNGITGIGLESAITTAGISTMALGVGAAGVAVAAAGVGLYLYTKHQREVQEESERTAERVATYGADVNKATEKQLVSIQDSSFKTQYALSQLGDATINTQNIDNAKKAMDDFANSVQKAFEDKNAGLEEHIKKLDELIGKTTGKTKEALENEKAYLEGSKGVNQQHIDQLNNLKKQEADIFDAIQNQGGKATQDQINQLGDLNKQTVNQSIDAIKGLKEPVRQAIKQAMDNQDITKSSMTTLKEGFKEYNKVFGDSLSDSIETTKAAAKEIGKTTAWGDYFKNNAEAMKPAADMMSAALGKVQKDFRTGLPETESYGKTIDNLSSSVKAAGIDWDQYRVHFGVASKEQNVAMNAMMTDLSSWNAYPIKIKKLRFEATGIEQLTGGLITFKEFNKLSDSQKKATIKAAGNQELTALLAKGSDFESMAPETVKKTVTKAIENGDVNGAISKIKDFNKLPDGIKNLVMSAKGIDEVKNATAVMDFYNKLPEVAKTAFASKSGDDQVRIATAVMTNWNNLPENVKTAISKQWGQGDVEGAIATIDEWNKRNPNPKEARSSASGEGGVRSATSAIDAFSQRQDQTKTVTLRNVVHNIVDNSSGHAGGGTIADGETSTWLGDGGKNEPYVTPSGHMGISGNDWELHALEPGTIVYPSLSAYTQMTGNQIDPSMIPAFAGGGTVPYTNQMQKIDRVNDLSAKNSISTNANLSYSQNNASIGGIGSVTLSEDKFDKMIGLLGQLVQAANNPIQAVVSANQANSELNKLKARNSTLDLLARG